MCNGQQVPSIQACWLYIYIMVFLLRFLFATDDRKYDDLVMWTDDVDELLFSRVRAKDIRASNLFHMQFILSLIDLICLWYE